MKNKTGYENLIKEKLKQIFWLGLALIYTLSMFFVFTGNKNKTYAMSNALSVEDIPTNYISSVLDNNNDYIKFHTFISNSTTFTFKFSAINVHSNYPVLPIFSDFYNNKTIGNYSLIIVPVYVGSGSEPLITDFIYDNFNYSSYLAGSLNLSNGALSGITYLDNTGIIRLPFNENNYPRANYYSNFILYSDSVTNQRFFDFRVVSQNLPYEDYNYSFYLSTKSQLDFSFDLFKQYIYDAGYDEGYSVGYNQGLSDALDFDNDDIYQSGYNAGESAGYDSGYDAGLVAGYQDGYNDAKIEFEGSGYDIGYDDAYNEFYESRYGLGYVEGRSAGYADGLADADSNPLLSMLISSFSAIGVILDINILPGISIGMLILIPVLFGIISFIIGKRGGND